VIPCRVFSFLHHICICLLDYDEVKMSHLSALATRVIVDKNTLS